MNDQRDTMPGAFPGAAQPSFEEDKPLENPGRSGKRVHFEDETLDHEDPANFRPDLEPGAQPRPDKLTPRSPLPNVSQRPDQAISTEGQAEGQDKQPPSPPVLQPHMPQAALILPQYPPQMHSPPRQMRGPPDHPSIHLPALPPGVFPLEHPPFPAPHGYGGPPGMDPYGHPMSSRYGPQWQGPGPDPFSPPHGQAMPPPWSAGRISRTQMRGRLPPRPRPPPPRQRVQYAPPEPIPIQIHESPPQIQIQHIPAPHQNNNNNGGGGNSNGGGSMGDAMQMMMMNQMMMQQMGAQQMQAAQFGAMINGGGGNGGGRVEARADASCGGSGGANVQNCQNQAVSGSGVAVNQPAGRRRRVRRRQPKPQGGVKVHVGGPKARLPMPPPPRVNAPPPPRPVDGLGMDNWQEASIILCLAIVALIYLVASRNSAPDPKKSRDPKASRAMAT